MMSNRRHFCTTTILTYSVKFISYFKISRRPIENPGINVTTMTTIIPIRTKGIISLMLSAREAPVSLMATNKLPAIGGVIIPTAKLVTTMAPKWTGLRPSTPVANGKNKGTTRIIPVTASITIPIMKRKRLIKSNRMTRDWVSDVRNSMIAGVKKGFR